MSREGSACGIRQGGGWERAPPSTEGQWPLTRGCFAGELRGRAQAPGHRGCPGTPGPGVCTPAAGSVPATQGVPCEPVWTERPRKSLFSLCHLLARYFSKVSTLLLFIFQVGNAHCSLSHTLQFLLPSLCRAPVSDAPGVTCRELLPRRYLVVSSELS